MNKSSKSGIKLTEEEIKERKKASKTIADLRLQQKNAIQNLDYDTAEALEKQMREARLNEAEYVFQKKLEEFSQRLPQIVQDSYKIIDGIQKWSKNEEHQIRSRINTDFESLRSRHVKDLISLEKDFAAARLRETERTIPEQEELLKKSKNAALIKDFELARNYREAANLLAETDLETRLAKTDNDFENLRKALLTKQRDEVEFLSKKLDDELSTLERKAQIKLQNEETNRNIKIFGCFDKYTTAGCGSIDPNEANAKIRKFDQICTQILNEMNCPKPKGIGDSYATNSQIDNAKAQNSKKASTTKRTRTASRLQK